MIRKNRKYKFSDGVWRTIIDIERYPGNKTFTNSDYVCYYVDIPFDSKDDFFEKYSEEYENVLLLNGFKPTESTKYIGE